MRLKLLLALVTVLAVALSACSGNGGQPGQSGPSGQGAPSEPSRTPSGAPPSAQPSAPPSEAAKHRLPEPLARAVERPPAPAKSPAEVVDQIVAAERAIARPGTPPKVLAAAGHLQQVAYLELGDRPGWDKRVRAQLPRDLLPVVNRNVASRRAFRSMHSMAPKDLHDELPAWRIVRPAPAQTLLSAYRTAERRFGVDWEFLAAINLVETGMGRIRGTSVAGAKGPMQFLPSTWDIYGKGDINSPRDAILSAGRFLDAHGFTEPGGRAEALFRYNNHDAYVRGVTMLARQMQRQPRSFHGYYHWQIYYLTTQGSILLPVGYHAQEPIPVQRWLARR